MYTRAFISLLVALLLAIAGLTTSSAQNRGAAASADIPRIQFEKYTLPNGLEVILSQKRGLPMVAVNLWYHVGPANEDKGRTGFAHLFEHMMFQSSKHVPPDSHIRLLEAAGASDLNGTTDYDRTNYFETVPVESGRARAVARVGSHGLPAREGRSGGAVESAGRRPQRAAAERRERAVRTGRGSAGPDAVPGRASVLRQRHRLARRHPGGEARRREAVLPRSTTRPTTRASPSSATSIRRR